MIHKFLIAAAHTTPIHQRETPEHQIIQGKYPTMSCCPHKKSHPFRNLNFPNTLPRETRDRSTLDLIVIRPNIKLAIPIKTPMGTVTPNTPRNPRSNEIKEIEEQSSFFLAYNYIKQVVQQSKSPMYSGWLFFS